METNNLTNTEGAIDPEKSAKAFEDMQEMRVNLQNIPNPAEGVEEEGGFDPEELGGGDNNSGPFDPFNPAGNPFGPAEDDPETEEQKKKAQNAMLRVGINLFDIAQSKLYGNYAMEEPKIFRYEEDEKELLEEAFALLMEIRGWEIKPEYLALGAFVNVNISRFDIAIRRRKENMRNSNAIRTVNKGGVKGLLFTDEPQSNKISSGLVANSGSKPERTNFKVFADGTYQYNWDGSSYAYTNISEDGRGKVNFNDLEEVKKAIAANGWKRIFKAYQLPDDWDAKNGFDKKNIKLDE